MRNSCWNWRPVGLVIAVLLPIPAVLAAMIVPQLIGRQHCGVDVNRLAIAMFDKALEIYADDHGGEFPETGKGLTELWKPSSKDDKWRGPYVRESMVPVDQWGQPLHYEYPGTHNKTVRPDIFSSGPDKTPNKADDIVNWVKNQEVGH